MGASRWQTHPGSVLQRSGPALNKIISFRKSLCLGQVIKLLQSGRSRLRSGVRMDETMDGLRFAV